MEKSFLSQYSSNISKNYNLHDQIHELFIDIENNPTKNHIHKLIVEAISYFNNKLDSQSKDEIITFISSCFLHYPNPPKEIINDILKNSHDDLYYIILSASICSIFWKYQQYSSLPSFHGFVNESYKQIYIQFENQKRDENLVIFNHKIPVNYQSKIIIDILIASNLNEKSVSLFSPYIFSQKNISKEKLNEFLNKVISLGLILNLPESVITNKKCFSKLSIKDLVQLIIKAEDETFKKLLPLIEETFSETQQLNKNFVTAILYKCITLKIDLILKSNIVNSLTTSHLKPAVWIYLAKQKLTFPVQLANQIKEFPNPAAALKLMPNLEIIPSDIFAIGMLNNTDFSVYKRVLNPDFIVNHPNDIFANSKFWSHLVGIISKNNIHCNDGFIDNLAVILKSYTNSEKFNEIFIDMIFDNFPLTHEGNYFLSNLLVRLDYRFSTSFKNCEIEIIQRIIESKIVPLPSFWQFINSFHIEKSLLNNNTNPIFLCAFEFSFMRKYVEKIKKLKILPQTNTSNQDIIVELLKQEDINFITNMNEECLSLTINAFIYVNNEYLTKVEGLTKEIILPFIAIGLVYLHRNNKKSFILTEKILNTIIDGCNCLSNNDSPILITSINTILLHFNYLINSSKDFLDTLFQMLDILIKLFINNSYLADKVILLSTIFKLSCKVPSYPQITNLFDKYGIDIFMNIVKNMEKIQNIDQLKNNNLNMSSFNSKRIIDLTVRIIQKTSSDKIFINAIYFIEKLSTNITNIEIPKSNIISRALNESTVQKNWDNVLLIGQFMKKHNLDNELQSFNNKPIPFKIKEILFSNFPLSEENINNIVDDILSDSQPEKNDLNFGFLFREMMKNNSIAKDYLTILFEKISSKEEIDPEFLLELYSTEYNLYGDIFIHSFRRTFCYHSLKRIFVRKASFENISLPISNIGQSLVTKLFNEVKKTNGNYKVFLSLKNVASSFPFLLNQNIQDIFDSVLPALDNFSLYFSFQKGEKNEEIINNIKSSLAAISFLHSSLYSVKILDAFVPWVYQNIVNFTDSQILSLSFIGCCKLEVNFFVYYQFHSFCFKIILTIVLWLHHIHIKIYHEL